MVTPLPDPLPGRSSDLRLEPGEVYAFVLLEGGEARNRRGAPAAWWEDQWQRARWLWDHPQV